MLDFSEGEAFLRDGILVRARHGRVILEAMLIRCHICRNLITISIILAVCMVIQLQGGSITVLHVLGLVWIVLAVRSLIGVSGLDNLLSRSGCGDFQIVIVYGLKTTSYTGRDSRAHS